MSLDEDTPLTFFSFEARFSRFFDFGEGALVLSTEWERRRLVRVDLASKSTVHQLLLPELSFWIFTKRLCKLRLCLTEFCHGGNGGNGDS